MIVEIKQGKTNFDMTWTAFSNGEAISYAAAPFVTGKFQVELSYQNNGNQTLYFNPSDTTWGKKLTDRLSFKLLEGDRLIGKMVGKTQKTGFFRAYAFYEITFNDKTYTGYEVGLGREGLFLCLYEGNELKAMVEKDLTVVNFQDAYRAYMLDDKMWRVVFPFVLYYDATSYGDVMEVAVRKVTTKYVYTKQEEVKSKYDPSFIPRVIEADRSQGF